MRKISILLFAAVVAAAGTNSCKTDKQVNNTTERPKNIILLIGDGMGLSAVSTSFYSHKEESVFWRFTHTGLSETSSALQKVTDSAASGTAMAIGKKTYNKAIGVDIDKKPAGNIVEFVSEKGISTGLVVTAYITHATPAAFYAHVEDRNMHEEIARQLLESDIDFFAGGGISKFIQNEDTDLFGLAAEKGFLIDTNDFSVPEKMPEAEKLAYMPEWGSMPAMPDRGDFFPKATGHAIDFLSKNEKGFFLMAEGSQIDWAAHDNDSEMLFDEMYDFEKTVELALDFAEKDGNTLVIVTTDHETGGVTLSAGGSSDDKDEHDDSKYRDISIKWATTSHSASLVPVFAYGPGAEEFVGVYENTAIFDKMLALFGLEK